MGFGKFVKNALSVPGVSYKRLKKFRRKLGLTGKQVKKRIGLSRLSGVGVSSAARLRSDSFYGPTGSIVGRY